MGRKRKRILWIGDAVAATGFARVNHSIIKHLDYRYDGGEYEIHHLGINYHGDPHPYKHSIYPATTIFTPHQLGFKRIKTLYKGLKPDMVFILNDVWTFQKYFQLLPDDAKIVVYFPIDAIPLQFNWFEPMIKRHDEGNLALTAYTKFGKAAVKAACPGLDVTAIPHGIDKDKFYPVDMDEARVHLAGLKGDEWAILNLNRNQPRKRIDITIKGFAKFAEGKPPNVKLYLHMALRDAGWDIVDLINRYNLGDRLIISHLHLSAVNPVTTKQLNYIYNGCNVGINTSLGEGWGLPSWEHSACGRVQIVPNHSACAELYKSGRGILVPVDRWITHIDRVNTEGGLVHEDDVAKAMQRAYEHPDKCEGMAQKMTKFMGKKKFEWSHIAGKFDEVFKSIL